MKYYIFLIILFFTLSCSSSKDELNNKSSNILNFTKDDTALIVSKVKDKIIFDSLLYKDSTKFSILRIDTFYNRIYDDTLLNLTFKYIEYKNNIDSIIDSFKDYNYVYKNDLDKYINDTTQLLINYRKILDLKDYFKNYKKTEKKKIIGWRVLVSIETLDARNYFKVHLKNTYLFTNNFSEILLVINDDFKNTNNDIDRHIIYLISDFDGRVEKINDGIISFIMSIDYKD
jgi:hypothetical protein